MTIDLRRSSSHRNEVSGARPKSHRGDDPAGILGSRAGRLAAVGGGVVLVGVLAVSSLVGDRVTAESVGPAAKPAATATEPSGVPSPSSRDLTSYAFLLPELEGLPPDAKPGTVIEVWVTWEPPVTRKLKVQRLIPRATVSKIVPSIEPGPPTVVLEVERRYIPDLLYGDRYGALNVMIIAGADE